MILNSSRIQQLAIAGLLVRISCHVCMAAAPGVTTSEWLAPIDGNWSDASKWSTPTYPHKGRPTTSDTYDVIIDEAGSPYSIRVDGNYWLNSLTLASPDVDLDIYYAELRMTEALTLNGGTISLSTTDATHTYATLRFPVVDGTEKVIAGEGVIRFVEGRNINILGPHLGGLRIEAGITIDALAKLGTIDSAEGTLTNFGTLRAHPASTLEIRGELFDNHGLLGVGGRVRMFSPWQNDGTIQLLSGGVMELHTDVVLADFMSIADEGGKFEVYSTFDLEGQSIDFGAQFSNPLQMRQGTLRNGRITSSTGAPPFELYSTPLGAAHLDNITVATDLTIPFQASIVSENGLHLEDCTITIQEGGDLLFQGDKQVIDGRGTIVPSQLPNSSHRSTIASSSLVIGEDITFKGVAECALEIDFLENRGTILSDTPGDFVQLGRHGRIYSEEPWTNRGTIAVKGDGNVLRFNGHAINAGIMTADTSRFDVVGQMTFTSESVMELILAPGSTTMLSSSGQVSLDGELRVAVTNPLNLSVGEQFTIVRSDLPNGISGTFANALDQFTIGSLVFDIHYSPQAVTLSVVRVPESSTLGLACMIFTCLACGRWVGSSSRANL